MTCLLIASLHSSVLIVTDSFGSDRSSQLPPNWQMTLWSCMKENVSNYSDVLYRWHICLQVSSLLRLATFRDHLFILNHILRCPAGVGKWAAELVQFPLLSSSPSQHQSNFGGPVLDHIITAMATILSPTRSVCIDFIVVVVVVVVFVHKTGGICEHLNTINTFFLHLLLLILIFFLLLFPPLLFLLLLSTPPSSPPSVLLLLLLLILLLHC